MRIRYLVFSILPATIFSAPPLTAGEPSGQAIAFTCAGCHGTDGRSQGAIPELNGEDADELYEEMLEFRSGEEEGTIMNRIAKGYSDHELRMVSEYFSTIEDKD